MTTAVLAASTAQATIVLNETFTYSDGPLTSTSGGLWVSHSGTALQLDVSANKLNITTSESEDANTSITGGAGLFYDAGILSATFDVTFSALPTATGAYFAHFKDAGNGFRSRLFATTTGATTGSFRLAIADIGSSTVPFALDLSLGVTYSITLALDVAVGRSSLSVNGGTPVVATDTPTSALPITSFAVRQASGEGTLTLDNLTVDASAPAVPEPTTLVSLAGGVGMLMGFRRLRGSRNRRNSSTTPHHPTVVR